MKFKLELHGKIAVLLIKNKQNITVGSIGHGLGTYRKDVYPIGYGINSDLRGQGIMSYALKVFIKKSKLPHLEACVMEDNIASQKVLLKNGFKPIKQDEFGGRIFFELTQNKN